MSMQEAALYGDLVVALRDYAAGRLAALDPDLGNDDAGAEVDAFVRTWFFTPQAQLYGSAPRDVIWREQLGESNPIPKEYADEAFPDCDCPICQMMRDEILNADGDDAHHHSWFYCPDTSLLERYDPEGSDERWRNTIADMNAWFKERRNEQESEQEPAPDYQPHSLPGTQVDAETLLSVLRRPWLDPELHKAARQLAERCDVPVVKGDGPQPYRRITHEEALSLVAGLHRQGVDVYVLLAQIDTWPYQNVALDWLAEPEKVVLEIMLEMKDDSVRSSAATALRFRHHRDFILTLAALVPPAARLWLSGWLTAVG